MKADRKTKAEKSPSTTAKAVKSPRRIAQKTNGKHPLIAYENIPIGIVETSLDGKYVDVNEEFCRILGYSKDELLQLGIKNCTHEDDYGIDSKLFEQLITGKIPFYRLEKRFVRKSGGDIWAELTRTLVCDAKGKPLYTVGVVLDISDRKDVERVLRESVERLRLATEAAQMFMWEWDFQKQTYRMDDNFENVIGFSGGLLPQNLADTVFRLSPPEDMQVISETVKSAIEHRSDLHSLQYRMIDPNSGQIVWLEANGKIVYNAGGNAERMFGVAQNITEKKKAEADLQFARRQAEQSADRTARLQKVTAALSGPLTPLQVAEVMAQQGAPTFGAVSSSMMLLSGDGQTLEIMYSTSAESTIRPYQRFPLSLQVPATDAARSGQLVWLESRQQYLERYPHLAEQINQWGQQAAIAIPLTYKERILGVLTLSFDRVLTRTVIDEEYLLTLARQGAQALERAHAEDALRESEERFRALVSQATTGITETDMNNRLIFVNPRFCDMLGYSQEQLLGKTIWELTYPEDLQENKRLFQQMLDEGKSYQFEKRFIRKDGSRLWTNVSVSTIRNLDGTPKGGVGVIVDIDQRKRAEEALRRNEQMFSTLVDAAPFGVYFIDSEFRLRAINKGSEAVFSGIHPLIGRDFAEVLRLIWQEPFATEVIERFRHTLRTGESFISPPVVEPRANIDEIEAYDWQIHRITLADGTYGVVCYFYDLSEQKRMEATVRASETLYRAIARNIPGGGVYVVDKDFRYLIAEGSVTEAFGLTRERLEGYTVSEVFPGERGERMEARLRKNFSGEMVEFETEFNERVYWTQQAPLHDSIGQAIILTLDITERKRAEDALRQSEERFARFMNHLPGLAWIKDMQGRYIYANAAAEQAFNTPREKLYGRTDEDIFRPDVAAPFRRNDEQALTDEKGVQVIETLEHADGVLHSSLVNKFPIPGPDGGTTLIGGTAFDITERLKAEEALRESEERFSAILRQATAGIVRKDADGRLLFVNQAFCSMLGYTESDLTGKTVWEFMHPEDVEENKRSYDRLMAEGIPFKLERRFLRADGSLIWVDASVSPVMDSTGKPQSAVAVEVDITGRKQAEDALLQLNLQLEDRVLSRTAKLRAVNQTLREEITERQKAENALRKSEAAARENEEKLSTLFELLPVGISFLDPKGQIIQMNPALTHILKLSKEQLSGQAHTSRTYIRTNGTLMSPTEFASQRALTEGKTIYNVETGIVFEDSEVIWTSVSAAPVAVADVGAVVVTADITESKRVERALQEGRERLQFLSQRLVEVQEEERRAIARELHDRVGQTLAALNINLIIISGQLGGTVDEQISTRLNDSMKLVAETISLVRDVMSNLRPSVLDDYGLEAAIESHLSQFMSRYEINVKFEKLEQPIPRLGPSVEMTFLRIAQESLMNIARHAQATLVNLSLRQAEEMICMTILDNGVGITSWQDANRPGSHGLTIMRERAEAFGGSLKVSSVPGQWTRVDVKIPVENSNPPQTEKEMRP